MTTGLAHVARFAQLIATAVCFCASANAQSPAWSWPRHGQIRPARESRSNGKDTILFDKALTGFGLRIHPSGRKVWIVQARIEGRSRRIVIAR